jgi:hypothetical protein
MRLNVARVAVLAAVVFWPALSAAQDVQRDWDKAYDFTKMKTFAMKLGTGWGNQLSENRVATDLKEALVEKGWKEAPEATADAIVVYHGATDMKHTANTFYTGGGGWGGYGYGGWGGMGSTTTTVSEYKVGTLVVDIFDAKTKNLTFRGTATAELSKDPKKNEKKSDKAAEKMFKEWPPVNKK